MPDVTDPEWERLRFGSILAWALLALVIVLCGAVWLVSRSSIGPIEPRSVAIIKIKGIEQALAGYKLRTKDWPTDRQGLEVLLADETGRKPLLHVHQLVDPWGGRIQYRRGSGPLPCVYSLGEDGEEGEDDVAGDFCARSSGAPEGAQSKR